MSIVLRDLTAGYERHPAVHHVSGVFAEGSLTAVVGPNGGGKSTLLKALAGFLKPMSGSIDYGGIRPRAIAYLPQQSEIRRDFPLVVSDVVGLGHWPRLGAFRGLDRKQKVAVARALDATGMRAFADRPVEVLSSGQWQRVLFARLIVQDARVILLDEPFAAIDPRSAHDLTHILQQWHREGRMVIAVMHDLPSVREHFPQSLMLARELVAWGPTGEVLADGNFARAQELTAAWDENSAECARGEAPERLSA